MKNVLRNDSHDSFALDKSRIAPRNIPKIMTTAAVVSNMVFGIPSKKPASLRTTIKTVAAVPASVREKILKMIFKNTSVATTQSTSPIPRNTMVKTDMA